MKDEQSANRPFQFNDSLIVHGHVYSRGIFLKKANHYDNFDCYTLGNAKPVVGTSENMAEPDYDVIKMVAILNFDTNLLCFIISTIVGRFQIFKYQNVQNDKYCLLTSKKWLSLMMHSPKWLTSLI